jgi:hypothetical protein
MEVRSPKLEVGMTAAAQEGEPEQVAIRTKHGERVIHESVRIDGECMFHDEIVKVWATLEGQTVEKRYWLSDLVGDKKREVRDVIQSNAKKDGTAR